MISVHVSTRADYVDILFEGKAVELALVSFNDDLCVNFEDADKALEFIFANSELFEKRSTEFALDVEEYEDWFDPDLYIYNVKEFHEGQEEYDKILQLMAKVCL